ncbi:MAG: amidohydrolase family protein, partial [Verrucomicrobiota bacterium]
PVPARDIVAMATCDGARALGLGERIGSLEAGKQADVICVDVSTPRCAPFGQEQPYAALVKMGLRDGITLVWSASAEDSAKHVASQMPREVRCTNLGGLSITPTAIALEAKLAARRASSCGTGCGCG